MARALVAGLLVLLGWWGGAQTAIPVRIAWDLDPTHTDSSIAWEVEIDGVVGPCTDPGATATERFCSSSLTPGSHVVRLRGTLPADPTPLVGEWSVALAVNAQSPGPLTIRAHFAPAGGGGPPPMAAPTYQSAGTLAAVSASAAQVPVPSGVASGDIVIVTLYIESDLAITPPSGFTQKYVDEQNEATNEYRLYTFWKRATGSDAGTYDFQWDGSSQFREAASFRVSGAKSSGDPFGADAVSNIPAGTTGTTFANPVGVLASTDALAFYVQATFGSGAHGAPTRSGTWTERHDQGADMGVYTQDVSAGGGVFALGSTLAAGAKVQRIFTLESDSSAAYTDPTIVNFGASTVVASGTALNVAYPLNVEANDIIICVLHAKNNIAWNVPTDWADLFTQQNNGTTQRAAAMWLRATGSETGTVNFSIGASSTLVRSGIMFIVRNAEQTGSPFDATAADINADNTTDDNIEWNDYDPATADDLIVWLGYYADDATTPATSIAGTPTATLRHEFETATGTDLTTAVYSGLHSGSHAAVGARSAAMTSAVDGNSVGVVFGILKEAGGGGGGTAARAHFHPLLGAS
jgi:hypothetical protein